MVLIAVAEDSDTLAYASERLTGDTGVDLEACRNTWTALTTEELRGDRVLVDMVYVGSTGHWCTSQMGYMCKSIVTPYRGWEWKTRTNTL
eukprot:235370-Amphidinium_carterae.2